MGGARILSTSVLSIRIRKELKEKMKKFNIDWRGEIEGFIEYKVRELDKIKALSDLRDLLRDVPVSDVPAWRTIREDREK